MPKQHMQTAREPMSPGKQSGQRPKHVPQRTCLSCRTTQSKRALLRLVRTADGRVEIDPTGKRNGRGAYLCLNRDCWELALKRRSIERALRLTTLPPEDRVVLEQFAQELARVPGDDAGST
jgi:hypothetical protein